MSVRPKSAPRLLVAILVAVTGALALATLAGAQGQRRPEPPVLVGGKLVPPPDMHAMDQFMERGPDGLMRIKKGVMVPVAGPDGQLKRNADGSLKLVPLDNPDASLPPITPGSPEASAATAQAEADGVSPSRRPR